MNLIKIHREIRHLDSARPDLPATNFNDQLDQNRIVDMKTFRTSSRNSSSFKCTTYIVTLPHMRDLTGQRSHCLPKSSFHANVDCPSWKTGSEPRSISACRSIVGS